LLKIPGGALVIGLSATLISADSVSNSGGKPAGDMCSLLSISEVEQALGGKVDKPTLLPAQPTSPGGCAYMAPKQAGTITLMVFEVPDAPEFFGTLVRGAADANHFKEEAVPGLGTKAVHMPSNFYVLMGKKVLMFTYGGPPRPKVEGLVRKLVAQLQ